MKVGIIGLGLIGGSMAIDIKRRGFASEVLGVEADGVNASAAEKIGLADRIVGFEECVRESDLVILAVPAGVAVRMLPEVLDIFGQCPDRSDAHESSERNAADRIGADETMKEDECNGKCTKVVMDVCSTKKHLVDAVRNHPMRRRYVATHPMAGTEYSGPWAAMPGLFDGRACIICSREDSDNDAVAVVERLYDVLNMRQIDLDASSHDVHTAYVSHISHITSFALALTVLDKEKNEKHIFDLASGGFSSTVRLAKSSADMWVPIFSQNRDNVLKVTDTYIEMMMKFREAIASGDEDSVRSMIEEANRIRRILR